MTINGEYKDDTLIIYAEGRIDTSNSTEVDNKIQNLREKYPQGAIILDCKKLEYLSSSGLRVLLKWKKAENDFSLINVSDECYDIFEVTGFTEIMDIQKAIREFSIDGLEMIGEGATAKVYKINDETIIKVFTKRSKIESVKKENAMAKKAFISGVATAISFDIVQVGDCYGVIYEMINAQTLASAIHNNPEKLDEYAVMYADFLKNMCRIRVDSNTFPPVKRTYLNYADILGSKICTQKESEIIHKMFEMIPDSNNFVHGDFHPKNIMLQNGELTLIDMGSVGCGHWIFDAACFSTNHMLLSCQSDDIVMRFAGMTKSEADQIWHKFITCFFNIQSDEEFEEIAEICHAYACIRGLLCSIAIPSILYKDTDVKLKKCITDAYNNGLLEKAAKLFNR